MPEEQESGWKGAIARKLATSASFATEPIEPDVETAEQILARAERTKTLRRFGAGRVSWYEWEERQRAHERSVSEGQDLLRRFAPRWDEFPRAFRLESSHEMDRWRTEAREILSEIDPYLIALNKGGADWFRYPSIEPLINDLSNLGDRLRNWLSRAGPVGSRACR